MQRLQVHVAVKDFAQSARFSVPLFAAMPIVVKDDYAKQIPLDRLRCRRLPLDGPVPAPRRLPKAAAPSTACSTTWRADRT
jgi:hypothetical protein